MIKYQISLLLFCLIISFTFCGSASSVSISRLPSEDILIENPDYLYNHHNNRMNPIFIANDNDLIQLQKYRKKSIQYHHNMDFGVDNPFPDCGIYYGNNNTTMTYGYYTQGVIQNPFSEENTTFNNGFPIDPDVIPEVNYVPLDDSYYLIIIAALGTLIKYCIGRKNNL